VKRSRRARGLRPLLAAAQTGLLLLAGFGLSEFLSSSPVPPSPPPPPPAPPPPPSGYVAPEPDALGAIEREFGAGRFETIEADPFLLAVERAPGLDRSRIERYAAVLRGVHERFMSTFQTPMHLPDATGPLPVVVLASGDLGGLTGRYDHRTRRTVVREEAGQTERVLAHEATHQLVDVFGRIGSTWLEEGLAMLFEAGAEPVRVNHARRAGWRPKPPIRLAELAGLRREGFWERLPREPADWARDVYAESWALAYFLLMKHRAAFHTLFRLELEDRGGAAAFEREIRRATGRSLEAFEAEWSDFMRSLP
jgi:hypothetical protein